jgi:hypothetical protein
MESKSGRRPSQFLSRFKQPKLHEIGMLVLGVIALIVGAMGLHTHFAVGIGIIGSGVLLLVFVPARATVDVKSGLEKSRSAKGFAYIGLGILLVLLSVDLWLGVKIGSIYTVQGTYDFFLEASLASIFVSAVVESFALIELYVVGMGGRRGREM